jgi:hypothetical protein
MKSIMVVILVFVLAFTWGCGKTENRKPAVDLHTAAVLGDVEAVQLHIKSGSDLNVKEPTRGSTPLISATLFGKTDVALALIRGGADINYQNNEGSSALHTAAFACRTEIVKALLKKGADKTLKNYAGRTALETVSVPFKEIQPVYDALGDALAPLGFAFDYERIKAERPIIAEMLE